MAKKVKQEVPQPEPAGNKKISPQRKIEIAGVGLILIGFLGILSVISNNEADFVLISGFSFSDFFRMGSASSAVIQNWLGLFGALLSHYLLYNFLGYPVLILLSLIIVWGWVMLRHHGLSKPIYLTIYGILFNLTFSAFFGFFSILSDYSWFGNAWSGLIGIFLASLTQAILGSVGGFIFLTAILFVLIVLSIDLDLKQTAARLQHWIEHRSKKLVSSVQPVESDSTDSESEIIPQQQELTKENVVTMEVQTPTQSQPAVPVSDARPEPIVRKPPKSIGIPLEEILPPKAEAPNPPEVVVPASEFKTDEEDFVPVPVQEREIIHQNVEEEKPKERTEELTYFRSFVKKTAVGETENESIHPEKNESLKPVETEQLSMASEEIDSLVAGNEIGGESEQLTPIETPVPSNEHESESEKIELVVNPVIEEQKAAIPRDPIFKFGYRKPPLDLLQINPHTVAKVIDPDELEENALKLVHKLGTYGIQIDGKPEVTVGPRVTLFEIKPAEGIKVSRITALADDIALAMAARGIRIMAPIPGKPVVGVEIPNKKSVHVLLREILESEKFQKASENGLMLPVAFGRTINNGIYVEDLAKLPHLLIAGTTGSGKSVGINTIICSLLYFAHPASVKFVMIDPKKIELSIYRRLEKHFLAVLPELDEPILTDTSKAVTLLRAVEREMDDRYSLLAKVGVRHLKDFNRKVESGEIKSNSEDPYVKLPYIVVIIDELADLMMTSGKEVEEPIARLAQLARAVGIHLVVATQRPSVDVITGIIKANFPARIAYQVTSKIDSRTILDMNGAEQLLGNGDMLYLPSGSPKPERIQNAFVSTEECEAIIDHIARQPGFISSYRLPLPPDKNGKGSGKKSDMVDDEEWDDMLEEAAGVIVQHQQGSTSLLQRKLKIGYSRAARIIDQLEILGIVGPPDGSKARQVMIDDPDTLNDILNIK